ncbi:MAG: anti-sigma factor antagonist [Clostridia bacterium]|nr:anti-sigma factor antagonist [Clostridia bacterium]
MEGIMGIFSEKIKDTVTVFITGDIDEHTAPELREYFDKLIERGGFRYMVINMNEVDFMDSTGIGMLIGRYKKLKNLSIPLYVAEVSKQIDKIFKLSGLYDIIEMVR